VKIVRKSFSKMSLVCFAEVGVAAVVEVAMVEVTMVEVAVVEVGAMEVAMVAVAMVEVAAAVVVVVAVVDDDSRSKSREIVSLLLAYRVAHLKTSTNNMHLPYQTR
jgi:hypothetical protein